MMASERRVCLLTGASGRFGSVFCQRLGGAYAIAAVYRSRPPPVPTQFATLVDPLGGDVPENRSGVFAIKADLYDPREIDRAVELTLARFGRIDLIVHAAVEYVMGPMLESDALIASVDRQMQMNVTVPLRLAVSAARQYWRDRVPENRAANRNMINLSSTAGVNIYRGNGQSVYSAAKAAMNYLTCHMGAELAAIGVRVNALAPNSFPAAVSTESVVDAVVELDQGSMTGKTLILDRDVKRYTPP